MKFSAPLYSYNALHIKNRKSVCGVLGTREILHLLNHIVYRRVIVLHGDMNRSLGYKRYKPPKLPDESVVEQNRNFLSILGKFGYFPIPNCHKNVYMFN